MTIAVVKNDAMQRSVAPQASAFDLPPSMPLVLDLDGTLISGDLLYLSFFSILGRNPLIAFSCLKWLQRGRAALKRELALRHRIDWTRIRLHQDVLALARREKRAGRRIVLATAADAILARQLASSLGLIDQIVASDGRHNLKGSAKADTLTDMFPDGFIYAGDSNADLPVWQQARAIVLVSVSKRVAAAARSLTRPMLELAGEIAG